MLTKSELPIPVNPLGTKIKERLEDAFDVNFDVSEIRVDSTEGFYDMLFSPFESGEKIFYRGERINSRSRRLVPTFLRKTEVLSKFCDKAVVNLDNTSLFDFYCSNKNFLSVYEILYGKPNLDKLYEMSAFAQHYLDISPFIDFSRSLFVALSFALKGRCDFSDDIVIYTAFDIDDDDTSSDVDEVNSWLNNYNVNVINTVLSDEIKKYLTVKSKNIKLRPSLSIKNDIKNLEDIYNGMSPDAKLIDIPTNDLMKYQQGVFLFLNDFSLIDSKYLTKAVRQSFVINKYVISSGICGELSDLLLSNAPQYRYECLMNISEAVKSQ